MTSGTLRTAAPSEAAPGVRARTSAAAETRKATNPGCGTRRAGVSRKWLIGISLVLAVAAGVLGSLWFGIAAILPLLYLLPCLAMMGLCMKGMNGKSPNGGS